jgi:hypothetical protein
MSWKNNKNLQSMADVLGEKGQEVLDNLFLDEEDLENKWLSVRRKLPKTQPPITTALAWPELRDEEVARRRFRITNRFPDLGQRFGPAFTLLLSILKKTDAIFLLNILDSCNIITEIDEERLSFKLDQVMISSEQGLRDRLSDIGEFAKIYGMYLWGSKYLLLVDLDRMGGYLDVSSDWIGALKFWVGQERDHTKHVDKDWFETKLKEGLLKFFKSGDREILKRPLGLQEFLDDPKKWANKGSVFWSHKDVKTITGSAGMHTNTKRGKVYKLNRIRQNKNTLAYGSKKTDVYKRITTFEEVNRCKAQQKREPTKVRAVVNASMESYLIQSFIDEWVATYMQGSLVSPLYMNVATWTREQLNLIDHYSHITSAEKDMDDKYGYYIPIDQSKFDHGVNKTMLKIFCDVLMEIYETEVMPDFRSRNISETIIKDNFKALQLMQHQLLQNVVLIHDQETRPTVIVTNELSLIGVEGDIKQLIPGSKVRVFVHSPEDDIVRTAVILRMRTLRSCFILTDKFEDIDEERYYKIIRLNNGLDAESKKILEDVARLYNEKEGELAVVNGLLSGYRFTSLLGTGFNYSEYHIAVELCKKYGISISFYPPWVQGDDGKMYTINKVESAALILAYNILGFTVNPKKFYISTHRTEFLRKEYSKDGAIGNLARLINSLLWYNPLSVPQDVTLRVNELVANWSKCISRGADFGQVNLLLLEDLSRQLSQWKSADIIDLLHTPKTVGGLGFGLPTSRLIGLNSVRRSRIGHIYMDGEDVPVLHEKIEELNLDENSILRDLKESLFFRDNDLFTVVPKYIDINLKVAPSFATLLAERKTPLGCKFRENYFGFDSVLKDITRREIDYIKDKLYPMMSDEMKQFSQLILVRGRASIWRKWLNTKLEIHYPLVEEVSSDVVSVVCKPYYEALWTRILSAKFIEKDFLTLFCHLEVWCKMNFREVFEKTYGKYSRIGS